MKKSIYNFLLQVILLAFSISCYAQTDTTWFTITMVSEKVWLLDDHKAANIYLIEGRDSSLIIDTGIGVADLVSAVRKLTDKPLIVINTHGHPDHCGANYQFEKVYIHPADSAAARMFSLPETRERMGGAMTGGITPSPEDIYTGTPFSTRLVPIGEGYIFNLGNRRIQVMETPGHTPGETCLLDIEYKLLFTGDNNNGLVWLFLEGCSPLSEYLVTLEKQKERLAEFDVIFPGHGPQMTSNFLLDQIECVKAILNGTCEIKDYKSFAGDAKICTYGRSSVAFNPDNL